MFNIKKVKGAFVTKSVIPTSPAIGRQLAKVMLENVKLQAELEQVHFPSTDWSPSASDKRVKEQVAASMADSQTRIDAAVREASDTAPTTKLKGSNNLQSLESGLVKACAGLGENIQTFTRDPITGEVFYGANAIPTYGEAFFVTNDDPAEGYYLLFNSGMTFVLASSQGRGDYMSVLYRAGSGHLSETDMQSIIKAKLPLSQLKEYYRIITPTVHVKPETIMGQPWQMMNTRLDWVNPTFILIQQLFRCDRDSAQIVW